MNRISVWIVLLSSMVWVGRVAADPILHGDFVGAFVSYLGVSEASGTDPGPPALYGAPTLAGESLVFNPVSFNANTTGGGIDLTDGTLTMTITSDVGLAGLSLTEGGDFSLQGVGSAVTQVATGVAAFLRVIEVDGVGINPVQVPFVLTTDPGSAFNLLDDAGPTQSWSSEATFDIAGALQGAGYTGSATGLLLSLDNVLFALSETTSSALIAKKQFSITATPVPEPTAAAMLVAGLILILGGRPSRNSA